MRHTLVAVSLGSALVASTSRADEAAPVPLALSIMLKVLTYDSHFSAQGTPFVVAVVSPKATAPARKAQVEALKALPVKAVHGRALVIDECDGDDLAGLSTCLSDKSTAALLLLPGHGEAAARVAAQAARTTGVYSLAVEESAVAQGVMVGVVAAGTKPQIIVNVKALMAGSVDLDRAVLSRARPVNAGEGK